MPELPDVELYVEHLTRRLAGRTLERVRVASPFLVRTVSPASFPEVPPEYRDILLRIRLPRLLLALLLALLETRRQVEHGGRRLDRLWPEDVE